MQFFNFPSHNIAVSTDNTLSYQNIIFCHVFTYPEKSFLNHCRLCPILAGNLLQNHLDIFNEVLQAKAKLKKIKEECS